MICIISVTRNSDHSVLLKYMCVCDGNCFDLIVVWLGCCSLRAVDSNIKKGWIRSTSVKLGIVFCIIELTDFFRQNWGKKRLGSTENNMKHFIIPWWSRQKRKQYTVRLSKMSRGRVIFIYFTVVIKHIN